MRGHAAKVSAYCVSRADVGRYDLPDVPFQGVRRSVSFEPQLASMLFTEPPSCSDSCR
jgi:hypothetical protein